MGSWVKVPEFRGKVWLMDVNLSDMGKLGGNWAMGVEEGAL